jgi:YHS domain-containing protein
MATATTAIDPVCGMTVEIATAKHKSEYQGQMYYFCAPGCKKAFEANPQVYLGADGQGHSGSGHHSGHHA